MAVEKRLASLEPLDAPDCLLVSLADDESVGGRLPDVPGAVELGILGLGVADRLPVFRGPSGATCWRLLYTYSPSTYSASLFHVFRLFLLT